MNSKPIERILEPEVMDSEKEAIEYDEMDHSDVNRNFVDDFLEFTSKINKPENEVPPRVLDVGTGTALIPIELCRRDEKWRVTGIDFSESMISRGNLNVRNAELENQIELVKCDAKKTNFESESFDFIISNSIIHHIPEPESVLREMIRLLKPGDGLFVRDLLRPASNQNVESLVDLHASNANEYQRQLFRQSLQAALTVKEVESTLDKIGASGYSVTQTTDRHWTLEFVY